MTTMTTTAAAAAGTASSHDPQFPCSIVLRVPLPTSRLASTALEALQVDPELSPLVRRRFSLARLSPTSSQDLVLQVDYQATTNRMLRVAVNSFMDSLKLILEVMEHLDVDVLAHHQPASEPQS